MGRFPACSFEELFQGVRRIPGEDILSPDAAAPIGPNAPARGDEPFGLPVHAKSPGRAHEKVSGYERMPETGPVHQVDVMLHGDAATVALNTSGAALNRQGYRTWTGRRPCGTLAAAMLLACPWRIKQPLHDPCCGTGTLLIEAAFLALDRAPGLARPFDMEAWPKAPKAAMEEVRRQARLRFEAGLQRPLQISGSDIDPDALELAERHVQKADWRAHCPCPPGRADLVLPREKGPSSPIPLRGAAGKRRPPGRWQPNWACSKGGPPAGPSAPSPRIGLLSLAYGRADRRRRLYNGRLECELLQFMPEKGAMTPRAGVSVPRGYPGNQSQRGFTA